MGKVVVSLVGKQGTGKSTIGKKIATSLNTVHLETSDVVAEIFEGIPRKGLTVTRKKTHEDPNWLGQAIYTKLLAQFKISDTKVVVLSGVREVEVHKYLLKKQLKLVTIEIVSDPATRCTRLLKLGTIKSPEHFIDQDLAERKMGLDEVTEMAKYQITTTDKSRPSKLAKALVAKLVKEGYTLR